MSATFARYIKFSLVITDLIICLSGLIMLITGSVIQGQLNSQYLAKTIGGYSTTAGSVICIIFGIVVLLIGSFGLYAATKDHHRFLILYSGIMSVVFIIQFITGVVGLSVKNSDKFSSWVSKTFSAEFSVNTTMTHERDFYQQFFGCCGWNGTIDYTDPANGLNAPLSCCKVSKTVCNVTETASLFDAKCSDKLMAASRRVIEVACGTLVAFAVFNFISIVLSVMMSRQIKNGYQYT